MRWGVGVGGLLINCGSRFKPPVQRESRRRVKDAKIAKVANRPLTGVSEIGLCVCKAAKMAKATNTPPTPNRQFAPEHSALSPTPTRSPSEFLIDRITGGC
jgi:hypothetical protein